MIKRILSICSVLLMTAAITAGAAELADVSEDDWYGEAVSYVTENGLFDTVSDNSFAPNGIMTRGMLVGAIGRMDKAEADVSDGTGFEDVPSDYTYAPYIKWAADNGIISGYDGVHFAPDDPLTREQMAVVFFNYYKYHDSSAKAPAKLLSFTDANSISEWALDSVRYCVDRGIIAGTELNTFEPAGNLTRAEAAQVIYRICTSSTDTAGRLSGRVIDISEYGHVTLDISVRDFSANGGFMTGDCIRVFFNGNEIVAPYCTDYTDVDNYEPLILNSKELDGMISVAINMDNIAKVYGLKIGDTMSFAMEEEGGYSDELEIRGSYIYTFDRNDYASDEVFANFREVRGGNIRPGVLYRSSSPIDSYIGRNTYADKLAKEAGIKTAINIIDEDMDAVKAHDGYEGSYYSGLDIRNCRVGLVVEDETFGRGMAAVIRGISDSEAPYLIHCQMGRDQSGLAAALLEAMCGADYDEIIIDYMLSYENMYHIERGSAQWTHIKDGNIVPSLLKLTDAADEEQLKSMDMAENVRAGLKRYAGVTDAEIDAAIAALTEA